MSLIAITKEPGVKDLPSKVRAKFAQAIKAEREGRDRDAETFLADAIAAEESK